MRTEGKIAMDSFAVVRDFELAPPVPGPWVILDSDHRAIFLHRLAEAGFHDMPQTGISSLRFLPLHFYPGWILCDIQIGPVPQQPDRPAFIHSLLYGPDGFTPLDGQSQALHLHNALHGVTLQSAAQQTAYLRFFCHFIHGAEGPFDIVTDSTGLILPDDSAIAITPMTPDPDPQGIYAASFRATIHYATTLFSCRLALHAGGMVEMLEDEEIAANVQRSPRLGFSGTARFRQVEGTPA